MYDMPYAMFDWSRVMRKAIEDLKAQNEGGKEMKKSDLKTGMWVERRNGEKTIVLLGTSKGDFLKSLKGGTHGHLERINEDLTSKTSKDLDIVKIWNQEYEYEYLKEEGLKLIWERKDTKEISSTEAFEILKQHYGCEVKIKE
jgi:hypothetical protein